MPDTIRGKRGEGRRRLIAGLRITHQDEALLDAVRPLFPEADTEGELAYRLWRRGLEVSLAEAASFGVVLPTGTVERNLAGLVVQRFLLCLPLLRRTGTLGLVEDTAVPLRGLPPATLSSSPATDTIDESAAEAITDLGGGDFL